MINNIRDRFRGFKRKRVEPSQLKQLVHELLEESSLDATYLILIIGSCAIATFGLLANSTAVIIGAMIIAPLMLPIRGLAFGALIGNINLFRKGVIRPSLNIRYSKLFYRRRSATSVHSFLPDV